jgi:hypothetical protein
MFIRLLFAFLFVIHAAPAAVFINEFMVDNPGRPNDPNALLDMDANSPGWIELHNNAAVSVTLTGWALSDDPLHPGKWVFAAPIAPATVPTTIPANGYRIVFCGGLARNIANVEPHATFSLNDGGVVLLSEPDGNGGWNVVSQVGTIAAPYPNQRKAISYGYPANDNTMLPVFFESDTPGVANGTTGVATFCRDTLFSVDRGFYDTAFSLTITCATPGATIAYTTNGNAPTPTHGTQVSASDGTTPPTATLNITGTTIVRAIAWKSGLGTSNIDTHTYLFAEQILAQSGPPPSMGLTTNDTHPWGTVAMAGGSAVRTPAGPDWAVETGATQYPNTANRFTADDLKKLPVLSVVTAWREAFGPNAAAPDFAATPVDKRGFYVGPEVGVPAEATDRWASAEYINPNGDSASPNATRASLTDPWVNRGFQVNGNVHVFGGTSQLRWKSYKLSMRFKCDENVNFPLYGDDASASQDTLILDARLNQSWLHATDATQRMRGDYVRDHVMADLQNNMGGLTFHTKPVHLFLNGLYWGLYLLHEKPDAKMMADYRGGNKDDYDVFKHSAAASVDGNDIYGLTISSAPLNPALPLGSTADASFRNCTSLKNYEDMLDTLGLGRVAPNPSPVPVLTDRVAFEAAANKIDLIAYIDYMLLNVVAANSDWPHKNYYASYDRASPSPKWRWHVWDAEHVFRIETENSFTQGNWANDGDTTSRGPGAIMRKLALNPEFRLQFADRIQLRVFDGGALSTAQLQAAFTKRFAEIEAWGVRGESARWGDNRSTAGRPYAYTTNGAFTTPVWTTEKNRILNTILPARGSTTAATNSALANLKAFTIGGTAYPLYPNIAAPEFRNQDTDTAKHGGAVPASFVLKIHNPVGGASTVYYTNDGTDPREAWTSSARGTLYTAPALLGTSRTIKARILSGTTWSALTEAYFSVDTVPAAAAHLVVSEFNYRPAPPTAAEMAAGYTQRSRFEYLELMNVSAFRIQLDGVTFGAGLDYTFNVASAIRELAAGARVLIVADVAAFTARYGPGAPVAGTFQLGSSLSDSGEALSILAADQTIIQSFAYNDKEPWPTAADGEGYSLTLLRPETRPDHALPQSWRPSVALHGSPGTSDVTSYAAWKATHTTPADHADADGDGVSNITEYVLKTDPNSPHSRPILAGAVQAHDLDGVIGSYLTLTFDRDPASDDVHYFPETSTDLAAWEGSALALVRVRVTPNPNGTQTEVWRSAVPVSSDRRRFAHIRVEP